MSGAGAFERSLTARGLGLWLLGAFLCWLPNLAVAELWLRLKR